MRLSIQRTWATVLGLLMLFSVPPRYAFTQSSAASASANGSPGLTATAVDRTILGQVVSAVDGTPLARVLVTINARAALTDSRGRFEFQHFTDPAAAVALMKPGYSQTDDLSQSNSATRLRNLDASIDLKMYPDAVITGVVTGPDGLPLSMVPVTLRRATYQQGALRWTATRSTSTNSRGEYRFREPTGRFQVATGYIPKSNDTGDTLLPVIFPSSSGSAGLDYFSVLPGEEKHLDLRPRGGSAYPVAVKVEPGDARGVQFYASTSGGDSFQVPGMGQGQQSGYQLKLPAGTYTIGARLESRDSELEGSARLSVTGPRSEPVTLHLEPSTTIPVELAVAGDATASTGTQTIGQLNAMPDLRQFNLRLHSLGSNSLLSVPDVPIRQAEDKTFEFRVPPGRYRLESTNGGFGAWYAESASYGMMNLFSSDIVVSSGASSAPIRIVANNLEGSMSITVRLPDTVDSAWVYCLPKVPGLGAVNGVNYQASSTTTNVLTMRLPVGSYTVLAVDRRLDADLRDAATLSKYATAGRVVEVTASATATVEVELSSAKELSQ